MLRRSARLMSLAKCDQVGLLQIKHFSSEHFDLKHDAAGKKFYVSLGEEKAVIEYQKLNSSTLDLVHTEVPHIFKGKGVGTILAEGVFDYVVENKLKMKLTCDFLQSYYEKNPRLEYKQCLV